MSGGNAICLDCGELSGFPPGSKRKLCEDCGGPIQRVGGAAAQKIRGKETAQTVEVWKVILGPKVLIAVIALFFMIIFGPAIASLIRKSDEFSAGLSSGLVIRTPDYLTLLSDRQRAIIEDYSSDEILEFLSVFSVEIQACTEGGEIQYRHEKFAEAGLIETSAVSCPSESGEFVVALTSVGDEMAQDLKAVLRTMTGRL